MEQRSLKHVGDRNRITESGNLHVREQKCDRCLFGCNPYLPWRRGGRDLIKKTRSMRTHFTCHQFENVMCRGFFDRFGDKLWYVKFAKRIGALRFIGEKK